MVELEDIICSAQECSAKLGAKYAHAFKNGEDTDQLKWDFLKLNSFIRTLCRNQVKVVYKKERFLLKTVPISSLTKHNSFLSLKNGYKTVCTRTEIEPCLPESEINHIVEQVKLLCQGCDCNL